MGAAGLRGSWGRPRPTSPFPPGSRAPLGTEGHLLPALVSPGLSAYRPPLPLHGPLLPSS